jgi:hypothetical protein
MAHPERAGTEARDVASGAEWFASRALIVERLQPIARRVSEGDQPVHLPLIRQRRRLAANRYAGVVQPCRERIERCRVRDLPAEIRCAFRHLPVDHQSLAPVVHPEGADRAAGLHLLHAEPARGEIRPVVQRRIPDADIAERLQFHRASLFGGSHSNPRSTARRMTRQD